MAVLPAPPHLPCGQPLDRQPQDTLLCLHSLEGGLCTYLKALSICTKLKDAFLLHDSQMFWASAQFQSWPVYVPHSSLVRDPLELREWSSLSQLTFSAPLSLAAACELLESPLGSG